MRNAARLLDKTFLNLDSAEERGIVHRDYLAHVFRWSHIIKYLAQKHRYKDAVVLDVGCGKLMPLAKTMYVNKFTPRFYVGVDANKFDIPEMLRDKKIQIKAWSETDFCALDSSDVSLTEPDGTETLPNIVTSFEVYEHLAPEHARRLLEHMLKITSQDCAYFLSTPCWNGDAAENHINETLFSALGSLLEDLGFSIVSVWGTFASIRDYKDQLSNWTYYYNGDDPNGDGTNVNVRTANLLPLFDVLSEYYDTNVLATIFAPLFPASSRNCLWQLDRVANHPNYKRKFSRLVDSPVPWTQSDSWRELAGDEWPRKSLTDMTPEELAVEMEGRKSSGLQQTGLVEEVIKDGTE